MVRNVFDSKWTSINEYVRHSGFVDINFGLQFFSLDRQKAVQLYTNYMQQQNNDHCLDIPDFVKKTDQEIREFLYTLGITNISQLQQLEKTKRDYILSKTKSLPGVSIRQLARITGISKSVIGRI